MSTPDASHTPFFQETPQGLLINIYVQPRASRNKISGIHNGALKMTIQAPPVDDAANRMCVEFLSKIFSVHRSAIEIVSGHTGRNKRVLLRCSQTADGRVQACRDILSRMTASITGVNACP